MVLEEYIIQAPHVEFLPAVLYRTKPSVVSVSAENQQITTPVASAALWVTDSLCIVTSVEELKLWVLNSMQHQFQQERLFSMEVYHKM
jgi:hypothetical protein